MMIPVNFRDDYNAECQDGRDWTTFGTTADGKLITTKTVSGKNDHQEKRRMNMNPHDHGVF